MWIERIKQATFLSLLPLLSLSVQNATVQTTHSPQAAPSSDAVVIQPRGDSPYVDLKITGLEGKVTLQLPELISDRDRRLAYVHRNLKSGVQWRQQPGGAWKSNWRRNDLLAYQLTAAPESDGVSIDWTITNLTPSVWPYSAGTVCMRNHDAPLLFDPTLERTFLRENGRWKAARETVPHPGQFWFLPPGKEPCNLMRPLIKQGNWRVVDSIRPDEAVMAVRSRDEQWVLAQAWHEARYLIANTQTERRYACTDVCPYLGDIAPGQSVNVRGMIYCFRGNLDALADKYQADLQRKRIALAK